MTKINLIKFPRRNDYARGMLTGAILVAAVSFGFHVPDMLTPKKDLPFERIIDCGNLDRPAVKKLTMILNGQTLNAPIPGRKPDFFEE